MSTFPPQYSANPSDHPVEDDATEPSPPHPAPRSKGDTGEPTPEPPTTELPTIDPADEVAR
jgi:hypothetical protein